ncbi:NAD(P)/FAD-dependent oxidoreductase [Longispora sp. NPDC051575]|uniref:flavin-containing monooxygenase n=1 Tax=Longispora sp. NPDC051575 TaxID=3154943 RepID=UPI00342CCA55
MELLDTLIIGGGQAGLATAHHLRRAGLTARILEADATPTGSWGRYYASLTLFSPTRYSSLPGKPFGGNPGRYPTRDEVIAYLAEYAAGLDVPIETNATAISVAATGDVFAVDLADGRRMSAASVVSATGGFGRPHLHALPGLDTFGGVVLHSADYRSPQQFAGRRVLVLGAGNSAVQIVVELADHAHVTLTSRTPVRFISQRPLGVDVHAWLHWSGVERLPLGERLAGRPVSVLDAGAYRAALAAARPGWRPMFHHLDAGEVVWADGTREPVDAVILATGYRPSVEHLTDLRGPDGRGPLDDAGRPLHRRGVSTTVPGLAYCGLEWQYGFASATLRGVGHDARRIATALRRHLTTRTVDRQTPART